jgi:N6-L-threonylcarbamoyladenine synthase
VILGIETSCDETAAAVVTRDGEIRSNVIASQAELHARYGGVVPEVASRRHLELVAPVVREALDEAGVGFGELDTVAVTRGPGLIGALLVGVAAAKAIAWSQGLPLAPVDHLHAHVAALYLEPDAHEPPFLALLASGGHTLLLDVTDRSGFRVVGTTLDGRLSGRNRCRVRWTECAWWSWACGWRGPPPGACCPIGVPTW